jgi:hypothetical protein
VHYGEHPPRPELAPYVKCLWELRGDASTEVERVVPDGCCEIVLNRADPFRGVDNDRVQPRLMLVGQIPRFIRIQPTGVVDLLGIRFRPGGLFPILGVPMAELTGERVDLADVCRRLRHDLAGADRDGAERVLLGRLSRRPSRTAAAIRVIEATAGGARIGELGGGARTLERAFRREVGVPPKLLARIVRFQGVIHDVELNARLDWAHLALDHGYYDQAHLIRDFKHFAGLAPGRYFASKHPLADFFSGVSDLSNPGA